MRTLTLALAVAAAAAAAAAIVPAAGCSKPYAKVLAVDPGAYHVRGDYIGSQQHVKLFVERLQVEGLRSGRGSLVTVKIVLLNERAEACTLDCAYVHLAIAEQHAPAVETHAIRVDAGELRRISLTFRTGEHLVEVEGGTLEIDGVSPETQGQKSPKFRVPFSATEEIVEYSKD